MQKDAIDILAKRQSGSSLIYPHAKGGAIARAMGVYAPLEVDTARVSSTFIISTPGEDRATDIVRQKGIRLDNYKNNPLVLYGHGFSGVQFPIGRSTDDEGKLHVTRKDRGTEATCFFAQSSWEAMQVFQLVEERILNCASVHLDPITVKVRYGSDGRQGLDIEESDLLEWSIVDIPCNAEAVRKVLDRGKLAERKIAKPLEKMLKRYAAQPKGLVQGMSLEKAFPPKDDEEGDDKEKQAKPESEDEGEMPPEASDVEDAGEGDMPEAEGEQPQAEQNQQPQEQQDHSQKPGAQLASGIHTAVTQFTEQVSAELGKQENPEIQSMANDVIDALNGIAERCADGYSAAYGGAMPQAGGMQPEQTGADPQEQQAFKRFTMAIAKDAATPTPKKTEYGMRAIAKGLSDLSMKRNLSPEEIHRLGHWSKKLFEIVDEAKVEAAKSQEPPKSTENDEVYKAAAELLEQFKRDGEKLQSLRIA